MVDLIACMYSIDAGFFFDVVQLQALVLHDTVVGPMLGAGAVTLREIYSSHMRFHAAPSQRGFFLLRLAMVMGAAGVAS